MTVMHTTISSDVDTDAAKYAVDLVELIGGSVPLRRKTANGDEWAGPCPKCGGRDRFIVRPNGKSDMVPGFWCRQCHWTGTAIDWQMHATGQLWHEAARSLLDAGGLYGLAPSDITARREVIAVRVRVETEEQAEHRREIAKRLQAITASRSRVDRLMREDRALAALAARGIPESAAVEFSLGLDDYGGRPALVIPWTITGADGETRTRAVQYRYLDDDGTGNRYRWHTGSSGRLYNADAVTHQCDDDLIVVEGALKAVTLWSAGMFSVCALPNKAGWQTGLREHGAAWLAPFRKFRRVWMALDPDALPESYAAAAGLDNARPVTLPDKPDDLLIRLGGDVDTLWAYIRQGRRP